MKWVFSLFLFFSSLSLQAQVLIEYPINLNMDQFDWSAFSDKANTQKQIDFENQIFKLLGPESTITGLNIGKSDLMRLEQELELYKLGIKTDFPVDIGEAEEAIRLHWENIMDIESQIQNEAGLGGSVEIPGEMTAVPMIGDAKAYRNAVWDLYQGDHKIVFNLIEKTDEDLYELLGGDDEAYAQFISPYVEKYMEKIEGTAEGYFASLQFAYSGKAELNKKDVASLIEMYSGSLKIYNCFNKNFKNPVGVHQQALMGVIKTWHKDQGLLGADSLIKTYENYGMEANPGAVVMSLWDFDDAPDEVKAKIGTFLRKDILNNEDFMNAKDRKRLGARVKALVGLKYLGILNPEEEKIFNQALEKGIIIQSSKGDSFWGFSRPLP